MRRIFIFILGVIAGIIICLFISRIIYKANAFEVIYAEQQTVFTVSDEFKVFHVLDEGALAKCKGKYIESFSGPIVFLMSDGQNMFYNDQIISVPEGKKAFQVGVYRFQTHMGEKIAPVVVIK